MSFCNSKTSHTTWPVVTNLYELEIQNLVNQKFDWNDIKNHKANVFIFISPECPLCENYTKTIKTLQQKYKSQEVAWHSIVAGSYYPMEQIDSFLQVYQFKIPVLLDVQYEMASYFKASVTPEVFVVDENNQIAYSGKIDNWMYKLGIKRPNITEHYLDDALDSILNGKEITIKKTEAVGCIIE